MTSSVFLMAVYFAVFALIHSLLADIRFKRLMPGTGRWYRLAYVTLAVVMTLPFLYILAFLPDRTLYFVPAPWMWLMLAGQILAGLCLMAALRQTGVSGFLGWSQLRGQAAAAGLVTDGFYCHLRNPLFFFGVVFLWLSPLMTASLLAFNICATIYFYVGALHEERSLREEFGQEYEEYRRRVPMFIPRMRCRAEIAEPLE